jgi:putative heme-binding domain-containing protein
MRSRILIIAVPVIFSTNIAVTAQHRSVPPAGAASTGKAIVHGRARCVECHSINERGGTLGPDLSWIGILRTPQSLTTSLVDPNAHISRDYFTVVVETDSGDRIEGIALNEDDLSIQIRDAQGNPRSFNKGSLKDVRRESRSLMPSFGSKLSPVEIAHVVSYLQTLRTLPALDSREGARDIPAATENAEFFDRPTRDTEERPELLMSALEIPHGAAVADIGSGTGYFTWRLAEHVGRGGKVYAVDVQQTMLDMTKAAVDRRTLDNVVYVLSNANDVRLAEQSIDFAFIAYAYHEFANPKAMMLAVRRALKPGGRVFILEYAQETRRAPASRLHSMRFDDIRREIEPAGFRVDRVLDFLPVQHGVIFAME